MPSSILRYSLIDLGRTVVHPNLGTSSMFQIFNPKSSMSQTCNDTYHIEKNSISICELTMPMICHGKCEMVKNCYSCFAHDVKRLNVIASTVVFLKSDSSILSNPKAASSIKTRAPNASNSSVIDPTCSTLIES